MTEEIENNAVHLCESCVKDYPKCDGCVIFGDGKGHDNICACSEYEPLWKREQLKHENGYEWLQ